MTLSSARSRAGCGTSGSCYDKLGQPIERSSMIVSYAALLGICPYHIAAIDMFTEMGSLWNHTAMSGCDGHVKFFTGSYLVILTGTVTVMIIIDNVYRKEIKT